MFGHDRRSCHLTIVTPDLQFRVGMRQWREHCDINADWVAEGGAGHHVDAPEAPEHLRLHLNWRVKTSVMS